MHRNRPSRPSSCHSSGALAAKAAGAAVAAALLGALGVAEGVPAAGPPPTVQSTRLRCTWLSMCAARVPAFKCLSHKVQKYWSLHSLYIAFPKSAHQEPSSYSCASMTPSFKARALAFSNSLFHLFSSCTCFRTTFLCSRSHCSRRSFTCCCCRAASSAFFWRSAFFASSAAFFAGSSSSSSCQLFASFSFAGVGAGGSAAAFLPAFLPIA
mmetsp:Transcript_23291/g.67423  ORF Transcript_23291/g.67423 Transcript_23291/m.67423 type:complete len:211 (+) Transcript_23291:573-1205(+)